MTEQQFMQNQKTDLLKERVEWLDLVRSAAIIFVVLCHCAEIYLFRYDVAQSSSLVGWILVTASFYIGRIGVPLFLMMSGYLLLSSEKTSRSSFYVKNLLPLLITTEIWILINYFFLTWYNGTDVSLVALVKELLLIKKLSLGHMWYMPVILGLYVIMPFVAALAKSDMLKWKTLAFPIIISVIVYFLLPLINNFLVIMGFHANQVDPRFDIKNFGGYYLLYVVLGYLIVQKKLLENIKTYFVLLAFALGFVGLLAFQLYLDYISIRYPGVITWYDSIFVLLMGTAFFELCRRGLSSRTFPRGVVKAGNLFSKLSLTIYFVHFILLKIIVRYIDLSNFTDQVTVLVLFVITLSTSTILAFLLNINPVIARVLCYNKQPISMKSRK